MPETVIHTHFQMPRHGWRCFHCGEQFNANSDGVERARIHFGVGPEYEPGCIAQLGADQVEMRRRIMQAWQERDDALDDAVQAHDRADQAEYEAHLSRGIPDLRDRLETATGRAISAEVMLAAIRHIFGVAAGAELIEWARAIACGDPAPELHLPARQIEAGFVSYEMNATLAQIDKSRLRTKVPG